MMTVDLILLISGGLLLMVLIVYLLFGHGRVVMASLRLVLLSLVLSLGAAATASAHECWWNGHFWVCPPRMPEWGGYSRPGYGYERGWEREREWHHRHWWCE